jgi:hypothetical protein
MDRLARLLARLQLSWLIGLLIVLVIAERCC